MLETRELKTKVGVIFCNLCNHINGKCVDMIVSAANFTISNSNSKCPQISSYAVSQDLAKRFSTIQVFYYHTSVLLIHVWAVPYQRMRISISNHECIAS